uniref:Uncharacterized protein n=1 Tax=Romanomermis culicivorax TaxID=13658 RepID=A0A915K450_ROMCU
MARACLGKGFLAPFNNIRTQKAFRYVILLPEIPSCNSTNNELLRFVEADELPPYKKGIPFGDAIEGTAKLALEFEHSFAEHCVRMNDVHLSKTFSTVVEPLCKDQARLSYAWCTLRHLYSITQFKTQESAVKAETRLAEIQRVVSRCLASQYNNGPFGRAIKEVAADEQFLNFWQTRLCDVYLAEARLNGTGLDPASNRKLNLARSKLEKDMNAYSANVARTAVECTHYVRNASCLEDAPTSLLYEWAIDPNLYKKGPYMVTLSHKSYNAFMKYCRDRLLRYKHFVFWNNRAAFREKSVYYNNSLIVDDIRIGRISTSN